MASLAYYSSLLLIFTSSWENIVFLEGIGRISRLAGIVCAGFWCANLLIRREIRLWRPYHVTFGLFVLWSTITVFWTIDVDATLDRINTYIQLLVLAGILWDIYRTQARVEMAMQAFVAGCYVSICSVFINYWQSTQVMHQRFAATGFNPNDFGLIVALGMPMAWYLSVLRDDSRSPRWVTIMNFAYAPAALIGILLAASRGSLIAAFPFLILVGVSFRHMSRGLRTLVAGSMIGLLVTIPLFAPTESVERLWTIGDSIRTADMNGRVSIWQEGIRVLSSHQMLGVGSGAYRIAAVESKTVAHNVFLSIAVEAGFIGLVLFMGILVAVSMDAMRQPNRLSWLWITLLSIWLLGAFVHTWEQRKQTWLLFSLVTASAAAVSRVDPVAADHDHIIHRN